MAFWAREYVNPFWLMMLLSLFLERIKKKFDSNFQSIKNLHFISCDISITDEIRKSLNLVVKNFSKIDFLINNAFYLRSNDPEKISDLDFDFSLKGTLSSVFKCIREIIPIYKNKILENYKCVLNVWFYFANIRNL